HAVICQPAADRRQLTCSPDEWGRLGQREADRWIHPAPPADPWSNLRSLPHHILGRRLSAPDAAEQSSGRSDPDQPRHAGASQATRPCCGCRWLTQRGGQNAELLTILGDGAPRHWDATFAEDVRQLLVGQWILLVVDEVFDEVLDTKVGHEKVAERDDFT